MPAHTDGGRYYDGFHASKAPQIVVKMKGNYAGKQIFYFNITRPDIGDDLCFAAPDLYAQYNGKKYPLTGADIKVNNGAELSAVYLKGGTKPQIAITYAGRTLTEGKDYTVKYTNNKAVTTASTRKLPLATITGKGSFSGKLTKNYTITQRDFSDGILLLAEDKAYSGKANQYAAKITLKDTDCKTLKAGTDYDAKHIQYFLQNDDGTETLLTNTDKPPVGSRIRVEISAKGNYSGRISACYRIIERNKSISKAKIQIKNQEYTGKPVMITDSSQFKTLSFKDGKTTRTLTFGASAAEGVDFVVVPGSYEKNTNKGTAKVTFQGVGQYGGYKTVTFKIGAKSIGTILQGIWSKMANLYFN